MNQSKQHIPQMLSFFPPDEPLPIGTVLIVTAHDDVTDFHWGRFIAVELAIVEPEEQQVEITE